MARFVQALRYKLEDRGFDSRWCQSFWPHYGPVVDSASKKMGTKDISWEVKAAGA